MVVERREGKRKIGQLVSRVHLSFKIFRSDPSIFLAQALRFSYGTVITTVAKGYPHFLYPHMNSYLTSKFSCSFVRFAPKFEPSSPLSGQSSWHNMLDGGLEAIPASVSKVVLLPGQTNGSAAGRWDYSGLSQIAGSARAAGWRRRRVPSRRDG